MGHQPNRKALNLQLVLPTECSGTGAGRIDIKGSTEFIQQLMKTDAVPEPNIRWRLGDLVEERDLRNQKGQGHTIRIWPKK